MNSIALFALCILAVVLPTEAQFGLPFETDCAGRLIDPFLVQALKSKLPKKFNAKLDYGKDLGLDAKYRLGAAKLLAKHMKNMNTLNFDLQGLMYQQQQQQALMQQQQQQQAMMQQQQQQQFMVPDQSALLAQQQQALANIQVPLETAGNILNAHSVDPQLSALSQMVDPRFQQQAYQLPGAQSLTLRPQQALFHPGLPIQM